MMKPALSLLRLNMYVESVNLFLYTFQYLDFIKNSLHRQEVKLPGFVFKLFICDLNLSHNFRKVW